MLISAVWLSMLVCSVLVTFVQGGTGQLSGALLQGAQKGVELVLSLSGSLCLWSGFSRLCEVCGLSELLAGVLRPILKRLFPKSSENDYELGYICENLTANLIGLGNAATPSGIRAVKAMRDVHDPQTATDEMCLLVVLNTASLQLIPSTVAALRAGLGAAHPFDLLPAVWLCSALSVSAGVLAARLLAKRWRE